MNEYTNQELQNIATDILTHPDFQKYATEVHGKEDWMMEWVKKLINFKFPFEKYSTSFEHVGLTLKILILLITVAILYYFLRKLTKLFTSKKHDVPEEGISIAERKEKQESYIKRSENAIKRSNFKEAIHYLFLASVSTVIRESHFHVAEFMTNRELMTQSDFSSLSNPNQAASSFQSMLEMDEPQWFGTQTSSPDNYKTFKQQFDLFTELVGGRHL